LIIATQGMGAADIALAEIAEGKMSWDVTPIEDVPPAAPAAALASL
jgi:hypothetical protein